MSRDDVLARVIKLLRLADKSRNHSEAEAMLAMEKAKALMDEYNISLGDIASIDGESKKQVEFEVGEVAAVEMNRSMLNFEILIATATGRLCHCFVYRRRGVRPKNSLWFVGDKVEVAIARELYQIFWNASYGEAQRRYGRTYSANHRSYCEGFASRLNERVEELRRQESQPQTERTTNQTTALVRVTAAKDDAISKWMQDNLQLRRKAARGGHGKLNYDAYQHGRDHGNRISLNKKGLR